MRNKITKTQIIEHLKAKKDEFRLRYGITALGLYGSYARDEANEASDMDVFYERDSGFELESGLEFLRVADELAARGQGVRKVDFVGV